MPGAWRPMLQGRGIRSSRGRCGECGGRWKCKLCISWICKNIGTAYHEYLLVGDFLESKQRCHIKLASDARFSYLWYS